jgi:pyruvate,orthophosphate dikinase
VVGCGAGVAASLEGKVITVDGTAGEIRAGILELTAWSESDTLDLNELAEIALRVSPLRAHSRGDYPNLEGNSEAELRAVIAAGHTDIVSASPLLTMLTAFRFAQTGANG